MTFPDSSLSRPTTSGFGKSTEAIRGLVPPELKEDFTRRWRLLGYASESDAVREMAFLFTYGAACLQKIHADRIQQVADNMAGIGAEAGR